jgi:hypothetical protein
LQNWGDYADMSQGVAVYILFSSDVLLICWFGTQLTHHVRENDISNISYNFKYVIIKTTPLTGNESFF